MHIQKPDRSSKFSPRAEECTFVGYSDCRKAYRILNKSTRKIRESCNVTFLNEVTPPQISEEVEFLPQKPGPLSEVAHSPPDTTLSIEEPSSSTSSEINANINAIENDSVIVKPPTDEQIGPISDTTLQSTILSDIDTKNIIEGSRRNGSKIPSKTYALPTFIELEPKCFKDLYNHKDTDEWLSCTKIEYDQLIANETWELVKLPPGRKAIGCKWIWKIKYAADRPIIKYKERLTAKGYSQRQGVDYNETYAPVAKASSLHIRLSIAAHEDWEIDQGNITTVFLLATLDEEIYMQQPEGFVKVGTEQYVCKLKRSIYGLKQSPRVWNNEVNGTLSECGLVANTEDPCIYHSKDSNGKVQFILLLYMSMTSYLLVLEFL